MLSPYPLLSLKGSEKCLATSRAKLVFSVFFAGSSKLWPFTVTIPLVFSFTTIPLGFMQKVRTASSNLAVR